MPLPFAFQPLGSTAEKLCLQDGVLTRPKIITYEFIKMSRVPMVTFSEGNGTAEVEEGDSKDTLACDDDAHKADVCT